MFKETETLVIVIETTMNSNGLVLGNLMESLSNVIHVLGIESSNGDTTIHGQINVELLNAALDLLLGQASVGEHTNLAGDVRPVASRSGLLQTIDQSLAHRNDSVSHSSALLVPLSLQLGIAQDGLDNASSVQRRIRPQSTSSNLQLREHALLLLLAGAHHRGSSATLSIETEVLGEGLGQADLVTLLHEQANSVSITLHISRGEALVSAIEDNSATGSLHSIRNLLPLLLGGIHTSGVVGAGMEQEGRVAGSSLDRLQDSVNIQTVVGIQVLVLLVGNASGIEHTEVVGPSGVGDVNALVSLHVLQEVSNQTEGTSSRKSLADSNSVLLDGRAVSAIDKLRSQSVEIRKTLNGRIFVVALSGDASLSLRNARKDHGLSVVVTVSTHSQGNLARILIGLEHLVQSENSIWGGLSNLDVRVTQQPSTAAQREVAKER